MAASVTALGTVIWSDLADAAEPMQMELSDDLTVQQPVKLAKVEHKQTLNEAAFEQLLLEPSMTNGNPKPSKLAKRKSRRLDFGSFEGY